MKTKITLCVNNATFSTTAALEQFCEAIKEKDKDASVSFKVEPIWDSEKTTHEC